MDTFLECGAQVTGAYFADLQLLRMCQIYLMLVFPLLNFMKMEIFLSPKPKNTGGLVNKTTITEQLLYETHNPNQYIVPDVVADMSKLEFD